MILSPALDTSATEPSRAITGDEVVGRYWEQAFRFAAMVAPNAQESQDIAQEALMVVLRRLDRYDPARGTFDAWLWRIVLNVARDAGRASVRRASLFERLQRDHRAAPAPDVELIALRRIDDAALLDAVRGLKLRPRTLLALRYGAGLSYGEVGEQLGMSEAAALMATRRALATLRRTLEANR